MVLSLNIQTPMSRREDEGGWSESRSHIAHLSAHLRRPNLPLLVRAASQLRWTCLTASSPQRKGPMPDEGNGSNTCSHATPSCHIQLGSRDRARLPSVHWHRAADLAAALAPQQRPGPPLFVSTISVSLCTSLTRALACAQVFELQGLQPRAGHARAEARQQEWMGVGGGGALTWRLKPGAPSEWPALRGWTAPHKETLLNFSAAWWTVWPSCDPRRKDKYHLTDFLRRSRDTSALVCFIAQPRETLSQCGHTVYT